MKTERVEQLLSMPALAQTYEALSKGLLEPQKPLVKNICAVLSEYAIWKECKAKEAQAVSAVAWELVAAVDGKTTIQKLEFLKVRAFETAVKDLRLRAFDLVCEKARSGRPEADMKSTATEIAEQLGKFSPQIRALDTNLQQILLPVATETTEDCNHILTGSPPSKATQERLGVEVKSAPAPLVVESESEPEVIAVAPEEAPIEEAVAAPEPEIVVPV
ncbi:MAG: hypothetical protein WCO51_07475, partial [bacterium]